MSHYDYEVSKHISSHDYTFGAMMMALMRKADSQDLEILKASFPRIHAELVARYSAPGGILPDERKARVA